MLLEINPLVNPAIGTVLWSLVAFLQAFIFSMLTAVFIGQAIEGDHSHDEAHAAHH